MLDSAISKQAALEKMQAQTCPPHRKSPHRSMSPTGVLKGPPTSNVQGVRKPSNPKRGVHGERFFSMEHLACLKAVACLLALCACALYTYVSTVFIMISNKHHTL